MADDYVKLDLAGDPEQAAELRRLHRQQIIADMLMKQSMNAPQGQMIGKVYVAPNPMQGIAQLGQAYMANRANQGIDQGYDALGQNNKAKTAEAIQKYQQGMSGTPERPAMQDPQELQQQSDQGTPAPLNIPAQPATQEQKLAAVREAILGNNPRLNKMGQFDLTQMNAEQARKEAAQNKLEQLKAQADAKAEAQLKHEELLKSMQAASLAAKPAEPLNISTNDAGDITTINRQGKVVSVIPNAGKKAKPTGGGANSSTSQKEIVATDQAIESGKATLGALQEAKSLNDKAMGFTGAGVVSSMGSLLPEGMRPQTVNDTENLHNVIISSALPQLRAIFGGNPTEGERKVLLDLAGSVSKTPAVRKEIFDRAEKAAQVRLQHNEKKLNALREGTFFSGEGMTNSESSPSSSLPAGWTVKEK